LPVPLSPVRSSVVDVFRDLARGVSTTAFDAGVFRDPGHFAGLRSSLRLRGSGYGARRAALPVKSTRRAAAPKALEVVIMPRSLGEDVAR